MSAPRGQRPETGTGILAGAPHPDDRPDSKDSPRARNGGRYFGRPSFDEQAGQEP